MRLRLGTRVTVLTTALVAPLLGFAGVAALRVRRADLEADLARQAREAAEILRGELEPLAAAGAPKLLADRAWAGRERDDLFQLEILRVGSSRGTTTDQNWLLLSQAAEIEGVPVARLFEPVDKNAGAPYYAVAVPLYDAAGVSLPRQHPARKPAAVVGLRRNAGYIDHEVIATARRTFPLFLAVAVFIAVGVFLAMRAIVMLPLRRLMEGIDAVGKGDLSRVILAEREDEIGTLASRFNAMTGSLREAREEGRRATEARLGLETRLRQSEKLATIGQMAAEIAHELGTPLNVIGGRARALSRKAGDADEAIKNARIISGEVDRITKIIGQVLDFSRKRGPTVTRVHLGAVVAEALEFLREMIQRQGVQTDVQTMPAPPDVPGDPDQIQQVCLNLLMNALHAMPAGGTLRIHTATVTRRKEGLDLAPPGSYALLEIADTGPGIAAAARERIFEPFFTTKGDGQGTGLGLAVSRGIVKEHDGWIEVESPPGGGAVFRVFLPGAAGTTTAEASPPPPAAGPPLAVAAAPAETLAPGDRISKD
ncbi:MAG TPA: ATP-binding protein [Polyangia bacterium]|nr:ATP-binding protein [Polyangia bacterium]